VLEKNAAWWGLKDGRGAESNLEVIEYRPIAAAATRLAALKSGELDFVLDPPVQDVPRLKEDPAFKVWEGDETRVITIRSTRRATSCSSRLKGKNPFKDKRVRQALYQGVTSRRSARR
jgi:peptide/nickel transport system substrate-binding protein